MDDEGVVIAKAYKASEFAELCPLLDVVRRRTILEVRVPESWWREPVGRPEDEFPLAALGDHSCRIRNELRRHPPGEQRKLARQWRAWYEDRLANPGPFLKRIRLRAWGPKAPGYPWQAGTPTVQPPTPEHLAGRNVIGYLALVMQLINIVPARPGYSLGAEVEDLSLSRSLEYSERLDLRGLTREGFDRRAGHLRVSNLGGRRIRIERDDQQVSPLALGAWWPVWLAGQSAYRLEWTVPAVVAQLDSGSAHRRRQAAEGLAKIGPDAKAAVPRLIQALEDPDFGVRSGAAEALGEIGPGAAEAVPALAEALRDPKSMVRSDAAEALGKIGEAAVPHLIQTWDATDHERCELVAKACGAIGPPARAALRLLIPAVEWDDRSVREPAMYAVAEIGPPERVAPVLISVFADPNPAVARVAVETVAKMGEPAVEHLLRTLETTESVRVRFNCLQAFQEVGRAGAPAVPMLIQLLRDPEPYLRLHAALALGNIGPVGKKAIPALGELLNDKDSKIRRAVARALAKLGEAKLSMPILLPDLSHENWVYRCWAAEALGSLASAALTAVPKLVELANQDEERPVRKAAARAVEQIRCQSHAKSRPTTAGTRKRGT